MAGVVGCHVAKVSYLFLIVPFLLSLCDDGLREVLVSVLHPVYLGRALKATARWRA
jgi:hypothetical protein